MLLSKQIVKKLRKFSNHDLKKGGNGDDGVTLTTSTWMYDIESNTW